MRLYFHVRLNLKKISFQYKHKIDFSCPVLTLSFLSGIKPCPFRRGFGFGLFAVKNIVHNGKQFSRTPVAGD
jgi:hypothetical protein